MMRTILLAMIVGVARNQLSAQDGGLDPGFAVAGILTAQNGPDGDGVADVVIQPDGKILLAGEARYDSDHYRVSLMRLNPDGSFDSDFSFDGKVITSTTSGLSYFEQANALAMQADGRIVVAGSSGPVDGASQDFLVLRYLSNGDLDSSFSSNGWVKTDLNNNYNRSWDVGIQADGSIVVLGDAQGAGVVLLRYGANGVLDSSFGDEGIAVASYYANADTGYDLELLPDGRMLVCAIGFSSDPLDRNLLLFRFNADGSLDETFGDGGVWEFITPGTGSFGSDVTKDCCLVRDASGNNVLIGNVGQFGDSLLLVCVSDAGELVNGFGNGGYTSYRPTAPEGNWPFIYVHDAGMQSDGKLVAFGSYANNSGGAEYFVGRCSAAGVPDPGFGTDGSVLIDIGTSGSSNAFAGAVDALDRIVVAGSAGMSGDQWVGAARLFGDLTANVSEPLATSRITVAPVPVHDRLFVSMNGSSEPLGLQILSADGVHVRSVPWTRTFHGNSIDVSELARGVYVLVATGQAVRSAVRFVKD